MPPGISVNRVVAELWSAVASPALWLALLSALNPVVGGNSPGDALLFFLLMGLCGAITLVSTRRRKRLDWRVIGEIAVIVRW